MATRSPTRGPAQLSLPIPKKPAPGWGGKRPGAGRKPAAGRAGVPHTSRPPLRGGRVPVHVTCRVAKDVAYLRGFKTYPAIRRALLAACDRLGMRIVHFS